MPGNSAVYITYTNDRGMTQRRHIIPGSLLWGVCYPWHKQYQWLLNAWDLDKQLERTFAMTQISRWEAED